MSKGRVINAQTGQEIHEEPDPPAWQVQGGILGSGKLERTEKGRMAGTVTFPVRGTMEAVMTIGAKDNHGQWGAALRIGRDECQVLLFPKDIAGMFNATEDKPERWHGYISVEGYTMRAEMLMNGELTLFDAKQPGRLSEAALKALGEG